MGIKRILCCGLLIVGATFAQTFNMTAMGDGGSEYSVWRGAAGEKEQVKGSSTIGVGDTLFTADNADVSIQIESKSRLLIKGGSIVFVGGLGGAIDIELADGQVFLDRALPREINSLRIFTKGFVFTPVGTAAAVKTTPQGAPTVAVLRGSMLMQNDKGESVTVGAKQFGTVSGAGKLVMGDLNERGLAQLEAWTGVKAETKGASEQQASSSPQSSELSAADTPDKDAPAAGVAESADKGALADDDSAPEKPKSKDGYEPEPIFSKPGFEFGAGVATINGAQWTRLGFGIDLPIWRFGVFLDLELFIDPEGKVSEKGWDFKNDPADAIFRKIRYIRYGRESDPLFVKFGGLSDVTLGYGIIMNRFTNMLHYPDEKLLGLQFYLNDISPLGVTLQALVSDFAEMNAKIDDKEVKGGIAAARLALKPLKQSGIPLLDGLSIGGTYALDRNVNAPAYKWKLSGEDALLKNIRDSFPDFYEEYKELYSTHIGRNADEVLDKSDKEDSLKYVKSFGLVGFDAGLPIINTSILDVTLYGQTAFRADSVGGWGMGAPGVAVNVWKLFANVEYRVIEGRFAPGFFDAYYLDERLSRGRLLDKSSYIDSVSLQGVYGGVALDLFGLFAINGSMQYMLGEDTVGQKIKNGRYEVMGGIGGAIIDRIPKISVVQIYFRNSNIGISGNLKYNKDGDVTETKAGWFDRTAYMYWGYRLGFEITKGASLIWDYRYGWIADNGKLTPDNRMFLETALRF